MSLLTPPRKKRIKRVYRHPNLLFERWLQEWCDEAKAKDSQMKYNYARALRSLKSFPLPLYRGADCKVLSGFGDKICQQIDRRLKKHIEEFGPINWEEYHQVVDHSGPRKKRPKKKPTYAESLDPDDPDDPQAVNHPAPRKKNTKKRASTNSELVDPDDPDATNNQSLNASRKRGSRPYVPAVRSGAYAILMAFHQAAEDEGFPDHLKRAELIELAQQFCDASFTQAPDGSHYTAWSSMSTLIRKNLITKEGSPARYSLTVSGEELCMRLVSAEEGGNRHLHISQELEHQVNISEEPVELGPPKKKKTSNSKKANSSTTSQKRTLVDAEGKGLTMSSSNESPTENSENDWSYSDSEDLQDYHSNSIKKNPDDIHNEYLLNKNQEPKQLDMDHHNTSENSPESANEPCLIASDSILEEFGNCSLSDSPLSQSSKVTIENKLPKNTQTNKSKCKSLNVDNKLKTNISNEDALQNLDLDIAMNTEKCSSVAAFTSKTQASSLTCARKVTSHLQQCDGDKPCTESQPSISGGTTIAEQSRSSKFPSSSTSQASRVESDSPQLGSCDKMSSTEAALDSEIENLSLKNKNQSRVLKPKNTIVCESSLNKKGENIKGRYLNGWIIAQHSNLQGESSISSTSSESKNNEDSIENENGKVGKENDPNLEKEAKLMLQMMMDAKSRKYERKDRMESTHKYKKYCGKNEKKDIRNNDYACEGQSNRNKQFSSKTKRRRKRKKSESSSEEETINLVPKIIDDVKQPDPPVVAPVMCPISTTKWKNFIFFDLETTSLRLDCDIVQIAAIDGYTDDTFNLYVKPTKKMDKMASFVTRISYKKGILRHNFKPVYANPAPKALEKFLFWIKQRSPVTLVAHNASFDSKRLFYALDLYKLTAEFKKHTIGFVDTLPLFKKKYPHLSNHKQETLVKHILNIEYDAHNALEDVKSLKEVYNNTFLENATPYLRKSSTDFASAHEQWLYEWEGKKRATTFSDMISKKCVSEKMADKMANSGLTKGNLEFVYNTKGLSGLICLLGKIGSNGKPRVTTNKRVIDDIVKYFTL